IKRSMQNINRRGFAGALAGAGFLANTKILSAASDDSAGFKLGVASYSLRKFPRTQAIAMVKQLNTPYISVKEFHLPISSTPEEIARGRKEFEDAGLIVLSAGVISFPKDDDADIRHKFEYAKMAGLSLTSRHPYHRCSASSRPARGDYEHLFRGRRVAGGIPAGRVLASALPTDPRSEAFYGSVSRQAAKAQRKTA